MKPAIAIVGMACRYPDARSPEELWENVLAQRRAFRRLPPERLRVEDYYAADRGVPDAIYSTEAALIEGYTFDRVRFRVAGSLYRAADLAHWLALDIAAQALDDAGFRDGEGLPRETTGAIVGNTLTGEFSRANTLRLRWPYVRRVVESELARENLTAERRQALLARIEAKYKEPFPAIGEESLAGGLSNTIAGRVCNYFDLKGGGYTVDGACAASLLAVVTACRSLEDGDLDVALAGGVDLSIDPFELVGFAKAGALAADEMRVYDTRSQGFWPGEGCGFVVLMREDDALRERRRIYAVIRGWGVSSDGSGGITRPEVEGQILSLRRAYRRAGFGIESIAYFEGHGTGTVVGDAAELEVITRARREALNEAAKRETAEEPVPAAIGSIKANIGHTKAAAGVAGLLKATLALHHQVLPPMTGCEQPHAELTGPDPALRVLATAEPWPADQALRAAVSAMGFGGINTHLILEAATEHRSVVSVRDRSVMDSGQDTEFFLFGAQSIPELRRQVGRILGYAARLSRAELSDLALALAGHLTVCRVRAALVASKPAELAEALRSLAAWIDQGVTERIDAAAGIFLGAGERAPDVGFLFSGQASPIYANGGALARRFEDARAIYQWAALPAAGDTVATAVAQPAIVTASLAGLRILERVGLEAAVAVGHSLGEITALCWAGVIDEQALVRIARVRGQAMMNTPGPPSGMLSIQATAGEVEPLLHGTAVVIAGFNLPRQTVVSGEAHAIEAVAAHARARGWRVARLPVSHAFHSPLMAPAAGELMAQLRREEFRPARRAVASTITGSRLDPGEDARALLRHQLTSPVRFMDAVRAMGDIDLLIEVGPGEVLTGLVGEMVGTPAVAMDAGGSSLGGTLRAVGAAYALGSPIRHQELFEGRFSRPFDLDWEPQFFANPCEQAPVPEGIALPASRPAPTPRTASEARPQEVPATHAPDLAADVLGMVRRLVADRAELPDSAIRDDSRLLDDLHLNSIAVSQLVVAAAKRLGLSPSLAPGEYADATVIEVARSLEERLRTGVSPAAAALDAAPPGIDSWIRPFTVELVERPASRSHAPALPSHAPVTGPEARATPSHPRAAPGQWALFCPGDHPLRERLQPMLAQAPGSGVMVCLPANPDESQLGMLLEATQAALADSAGRFIVVQEGGGAAELARTLHLESPETVTCVLDLPFDDPRAADWILAETRAASGHTEVHYDAGGVRRVPVLRPLALEECHQLQSLGQEDVLLVTGGGKGIAAECALALASETGCRLALIGRSDPSSDAELKANLDRIGAARIRFRYLAADVTVREQIRVAIREAQSSLGPITAILHGAGVNAPQLLKTLDLEALRRTVAVKVEGARNVLDSIDRDRLKLFVAFGSIIARTGLAGEADYALANGWLTRLTERLQQQCPHIRCLSIEWSVWSGVGMGERLGRVDTLIQQGVTPISPDQGAAIFKRLLLARPPQASVIVGGRFGALPTLEVEQPELPLMRFLERPRMYFPGIELVAESDLSLETDPYLDDHVFAGERLLPAVMGLEAMAQAASALTGSRVAAIEEVRFERPIVVAAGGHTTIRVAALVRGPDRMPAPEPDGSAAFVRRPARVELALRCMDTEFQVNHFSAVCVMEGEARSTGNGHPPPSGNGETTRAVPIDGTEEAASNGRAGNGSGSHLEGEKERHGMIALEPERDLYGGILFQRGRFQRLRGYRRLKAHECVADLSADGDRDWFGRYQPRALVLGDPGARDSTLHAIQACIPHAVLLPVGAHRVSFMAPSPSGPRSITAREVAREGPILVYDVDVMSADGTVCERWERLRLRIVGEGPRMAPWNPALLVPYLERRVADLIPGSGLSVVLRHASGTDRRPRSDAAIRELIGDRGAFRRRPDGKPEVNGGPSVSAAHAGGFTLAVAGPGPIGCDLEPVVHRPAALWRDLLGLERATLTELVARESGEDFDASATRVWAAGECLKKAGASPGGPMTVDLKTSDGWLLMVSGRLRVATVSIEVRGTEGPLVIALLAEDRPQTCEHTSTDTSSGSKKPTWSATSTTSTT